MALSDGLWAYWRMEETTGSNRLDSSGNGRTLVLTDPDNLFRQGSGKLNYGVDVLRKAVDASKMELATGESWNNQPFSFAIWANCAYATSPWADFIYLVDMYPSVGVPVCRFTIYTYSTPQMCEVLFNTDAGAYLLTDHTMFSTNSWHLVVVTSNGSTSSTMYIDNTLVASDAGGCGHTIGATFRLRPVCNAAGSTAFWDELAIWNRQLATQDLITLWNGGKGRNILVTPGAANNTLVYTKDLMEGRHGWFYDKYTPGVQVHYGEEGANVHSILCGGADGAVYQLTGDSDNGDPVACEITTESRDQGDTRYNKLYGDVMLDCNTGSVNVTATPKFNNDATSGTATTVNNAVRTQVPLSVGAEWATARNISLDLTWNMNGARSYFYIWEPRYTEEGGKLFAYDWETCFISHELPGYFYHGYLYLVHISTANLTLTITDEDGTVKTTTTIAHSAGLHKKDFIRLPVIKGKLFKYRLSSATQFRVEGQESELLVKPWGMGGAWKRQRIFQDAPRGEAA